MYISYDDTPNFPFCRLNHLLKRLDTHLNKLTNQNTEKNTKDDEQTNKKMLL